jgi:hypothetical protein
MRARFVLIAAAIGAVAFIPDTVSASNHNYGACSWSAAENIGAGTASASEISYSCHQVQARFYWQTPTGGSYTYTYCAADPSFSSCTIGSGTFITGGSRGATSLSNWSGWFTTT